MLVKLSNDPFQRQKIIPRIILFPGIMIVSIIFQEFNKITDVRCIRSKRH